MNDTQLSRRIADVRRIIRALEAQCDELDLLILREPTGQARNEMADANILVRQGVQSLLNVC